MYFVTDEIDSPNKYSETNIIRMVEFLNINCGPLVCSYIHMKLILYNIYKRVSSRSKKTSFNLTFRYIDDVLSLNNPKFNDYIDGIYPKEL